MAPGTPSKTAQRKPRALSLHIGLNAVDAMVKLLVEMAKAPPAPPPSMVAAKPAPKPAAKPSFAKPPMPKFRR